MSSRKPNVRECLGALADSLVAHHVRHAGPEAMGHSQEPGTEKPITQTGHPPFAGADDQERLLSCGGKDIAGKLVVVGWATTHDSGRRSLSVCWVSRRVGLKLQEDESWWPCERRGGSPTVGVRRRPRCLSDVIVASLGSSSSLANVRTLNPRGPWP